MVYCGKPSKSCRRCRERDIKCDKRPVSCGQCTRALITCPGYADPENLVFRDEAHKVVKRASNRKKRPSVNQPSPGITKSSAHSLNKNGGNGLEKLQSIFQSPPLTFHPIAQGVQQRAKYYFISIHLTNPLLRVPGFSTLHSIAVNGPTAPHLVFAARAVSLALFSRYNDSAISIMQSARLHYGAALHQTQNMVVDSHKAKHDSTLVAVLYLYVYEKLFGHKDGKKEERRHLDGALALVKLRGTKQFSNEIGNVLFQQLISGVWTDCLEQEIDVPEELVIARRAEARKRDISELSWKFEEFVIKFVAFMARKADGMLDKGESIICASELQDESLELYQLFQDVQTPSIETDKSGCINKYRAGRSMGTNQLLIQLSILRLVLAEIMASEPSGARTKSQMTLLCKSIYISSLDNCVGATSQIFLFPLYVAACSHFCSLSLNKRIKILIMKQQGPGIAKIIELLGSQEQVSGPLWKERLRNPWADFAKEGLSEFSMLGA